MPRMGENIRKRKDGRYEGRYADGYKADGSVKYRSVYGKTYVETKKKLHEAAGGKLIPGCTKNKLLVSQVSYMWLHSKKPYIKQSTYFRYLSVVEKHINSHFDNIRLTSVTDQMTQGFSAKLMYALKPKTVRDILTVWGQVLDYAAECGMCNNPPVRIKMPKASASATKIFSIAEQRKLTAFLTNDADLQKLGVLICLNTGMRLGEICALKWKDIDIINCVIKVRRTIQRIGNGSGETRFLIDTPKTLKSIRDIPIPCFIMRRLLENKCDDRDAYFLTGSSIFIQPRTYQNRLKSYIRDCGLSDEYHFHTLRHTFASRAIELGFDPKTLSEILGHANVNITLNRYVHTSIELKRRNMELLQTIE